MIWVNGIIQYNYNFKVKGMFTYYISREREKGVYTDADDSYFVYEK